MTESDVVSPDNAATENVVLGGRFEIQPRLPMPELSHKHARAFAALDLENLSGKAYALIVEHDLPVREQTLLSLKGSSQSLAQPLGWGSVDWPPAGRARMAIVLVPPPGRRLVKAGPVDIAPLPVKTLTSEFLPSMATLLRELGDMRVTHRGIRPDNLYHDRDGGGWALGECFSTPPGYAQPVLYEPVARAMAMPEGRGHGSSADDYYALGATLAVLAMGNGPLLALTAAQIIESKMELGSFAAITAGRRPPNELTEVLRGLLNDHPESRWGAKELDNWLLGRRQNPHAPQLEQQASRGFPFNGRDYTTLGTLAFALGTDWEHARAVIKDGALERWVRLNMKQPERADAIAGCRVSTGKDGPRMISDDLLVARTITVLDPGGPLRFRDFAAMPDGLGPALAAAMQVSELSHFFSEMIGGMLPAFRVAQEAKPTASQLSLQDVGLALRRHVTHRGPGYGVERCLYELNTTLQCLSPRIANHYATNVHAVLVAMDMEAGSEESPVDRHIAAFLAARLTTAVDRNLNEIAAATRPADAILGQLRLLSLAQEEVGGQLLPKLCAAFFRHMGPIIAGYKNLPLRKRIRQAAEKAVDQGRLAAFLGIIDNKHSRQWDTTHHRQARARHANAQFEIERLMTASEHRQTAADKLGHQWAATLSAIIAAAAVAATMFTKVS